MKRTFTTTLMAIILCVCMVFGLTACTSQEDIDNAVNEATAPLNGQITELEAEIANREAELATLEEEKEALISEKEALEAEIAELETSNETLEDEKAALNATVAQLEASIAEKDAQIAELNSSIATLTEEKQALTDRVAELEKENAIFKNCFAGKHVVNEEEAVSYTYAWSETAPTSTMHYTCVHCKNAGQDPVSPSVWKEGDKITYIAKDGNAYLSTVGEVTDENAVLVSDNGFAKTATLTNEEQFLALLEPVGARYPYSNETVYAEIIEPWLVNTLIPTSDETLSYYYSVDQSQYRLLKSNFRVGAQGSSYKAIRPRSDYYKYESTYHYRYIWDIAFSTAE